MAWRASLDDVGPRNGDVLVRTAHGRMVAVIYAAATPEETMRRAECLMQADPARKPVGALTSEEMLELSPDERAVAMAAISADSEDSCMISGCMEWSERGTKRQAQS